MKKYIFTSILILFFITIIFDVLLFAATNQLKIIDFSGNVMTKTSLLSRWKDVTSGQSLENKERLKILGNGFCKLNDLFMTDYLLNKNTLAKFNNNEIYLYTGEIYFDVKSTNVDTVKVFTQNSLFMIYTPGKYIISHLDNNTIIKNISAESKIKLSDKEITLAREKYGIIQGSETTVKQDSLKSDYIPLWIK